MKPRVAVLLATFNGALFLDEQLDSILGQVDVEVAIFARDDGSTDETPARLAAWRNRDATRIRLIKDVGGRLGSASANFFRLVSAVHAGDFEFFAFADQDDIWLPDKLSRAIAQLRDTGSEGYSSNLIPFGEHGQRGAVIDKAQPQKLWDYMFQGASAGCTYVLSARAFDLIQVATARLPSAPFNLSHDWTIYALCRSHGLKWVQDASAKILYRQHAANAYGALQGPGGLLVRLRSSRSGWYRRHIEWLGSVLASSPEEQAILSRLSRDRIADRLWLAARCRSFRRRPRDQLLLCMAFLTGMV